MHRCSRRHGQHLCPSPRSDPSLPPIAIGSHLDTQPTGRKYDGVIGVLAGLEVLRTLQDQGYETNAPIEVIDWTNEEGSRFAPAMLSSGVFAGVFDTAYAYARQDREGERFGEELRRIGYKGDIPCGSHALGAHFELHIEQGPILEAEAKTIGVVTGVQGMRWYEVTVTGMEGHAGSTPMRLRRDALLGASRMVAAVNDVGWSHAPDAVATVGLLESRPNSRNVVPGSVFFTIDLRHPDDAVVAPWKPRCARSWSGSPLTRDSKSPSSAFGICRRCGSTPTASPRCGARPRLAGYASREIVSGAGHDLAYIARVAPTTMVFVPCEKGLSHNEAEHAEKSRRCRRRECACCARCSKPTSAWPNARAVPSEAMHSPVAAAGNRAAVIEARGLGVTFVSDGHRTVALADVDLPIRKGEFVSLIGPSGCGKTTLLRLIADLQQATTGTLAVNGITPEAGPQTASLRLCLSGSGAVSMAKRRTQRDVAAGGHGGCRSSRTARRGRRVLDLVG